MSRTGYRYGKGEDFGSITVYHMIKVRADLQKGGCAGWWRRAVIGLGLILGPTPKEVWTRLATWLAIRIRSLMGKAAHLCRV